MLNANPVTAALLLSVLVSPVKPREPERAAASAALCSWDLVCASIPISTARAIIPIKATMLTASSGTIAAFLDLQAGFDFVIMKILLVSFTVHDGCSLKRKRTRQKQQDRHRRRIIPRNLNHDRSTKLRIIPIAVCYRCSCGCINILH